MMGMGVQMWAEADQGPKEPGKTLGSILNVMGSHSI